MAEKSISITFDGYWRDENKEGLPAKSGIYCVYECTYNLNDKTIRIHKLIYVGEADDVRARVVGHEKYKTWLNYVGKGNELCFSFGEVGSLDRSRAEAAIIYKHKPPANDQYIVSFPFDKTTISLSGKTALLDEYFTVSKT